MTNRTMTAGLAILMLSTVIGLGAAQAGPCTTGSNKTSDAGSGPTPGNTGQTTTTTGSASTAHPPTNAVGSAAGGSAASSEDAQRQTQGQPTAAQQAQGATSSSNDQGC